MRSTNRRLPLMLAVCAVAMSTAVMSGRVTASAQDDRSMGPMPMMPPMTSEIPPLYRQPTVVGVIGIALLGAGFAAYRVIQGRRGRAVRASSEAVLVVDLVESTHLATHWGDTVAMRARNALKELALSVAKPHGLVFAESTGDGWFMTFPSTVAAVESAVELLHGLRSDPPDVAPAPPLEARLAITYGEIFFDGRGKRHGATIHKAFRLVGLSPTSLAHLAGGPAAEGELSDRDRILLDEEATQELDRTARPRRFVGFASLRGFGGLHRVYEVDWRSDDRH